MAWFRLAVLAVSVPAASSRAGQAGADWLLDPAPYVAHAEASADGHEITLENGLVRRVFRLAPNAATVALDNLTSGQSELRSVRPEAVITLNGNEYAVGGLTGQPIHNYLLSEWLDQMTAIPNSFTVLGHRIGKTRAPFAWKRRTGWLASPAAEAPWPPPGVSLELNFTPPPESGLDGVAVTVHYELYDGIPLIGKWLSVVNTGPGPVRIDRFKAEILASVEPASYVEGRTERFVTVPRSMHVETDYSFGGSMESGVEGPGFRWVSDPLYETQVHYERRTPCLLECSPPLGPAVSLAAGGTFHSYRVFELLFDSTERERRGLAQRRMYRTLVPWVCENPLIFHAGSAAPDAVRRAIDQAAEVGFELVIMTFGSGFDIENTDPAYLAQLKALADYAHAKGIGLGGYSLLSSRSIDADNDVIDPATSKPGGFAVFGNAPCLGSKWGQDYFAKLYRAYERTGLDALEHDGSYPGDLCASITHPGHVGLNDSQWAQWSQIAGFYRWCRERGVYLNVPDWYYLCGSSKCGMGYRETNWSLPRASQEIIERQNIFDGTWTKTPSMGWMFVPLTEYHGGGAAATIEPLDEHRDHYERRLGNLLGAGVQACFRGPRLYDTDATREMVRARVAWFKAHRAILESDIVHGRRPDGRDLDWILHVNPRLRQPAMLVVYNPAAEPVERSLPLDLYYSGLTGRVRMSAADGPAEPLDLDARGRAEIRVQVPARGMAWYVFSREEAQPGVPARSLHLPEGDACSAAWRSSSR